MSQGRAGTAAAIGDQVAVSPQAARHHAVKEALYRAHQLTGDAQARYLESLGERDAELRQEVVSLLGVRDESVFSRGPLPPASPRAPFAVGTMIAARYEIESPLGQGGMGEVYRARDRMLGANVALKRLLFPSPQSRRQLIEEALHARRVTHPAVCRVFDVGEAEGELFLTMELLEGEDLGQRIQRQGALSAPEVRALARQLIEGLGAAHDAGVIHRDLKPANIVYHRDLPRLTDFGIAVSDNRRSEEGFAGTPGYLAPEALPPRGWFSVGSDFYALGLVLREALTGRPALWGRDWDDLTARMRHPDLEPLSILMPELDDDLARLIDWCLAVDPHRRPGASSELLALLAGRTPASLRPAAPAAPGRYVDLTVLGRGEFSEVVRALDRLSGRVVALKRLRGGEANPSFLRGIDPTRLAEHPHFVPVLDVGKDEQDQPFVVSTLLEGAQEWTTHGAGLPTEDLRHQVADLFAALDFLHRRGQVHGNLRSSNVLWVEGRLKLLDATAWCPQRLEDATREPRQDLEQALILVRRRLEIPDGEAAEPRWLAELQTLIEGPDAEAGRAAQLVRPDVGSGPHNRPRHRFSLAPACTGRRQELDQLNAWLDELERGQGRVVLVEGESGLGKTRLLEELRLAAWRRGLLTAWGQASEASTEPYLPWHDVWRRLALETPIESDAFASFQGVIPDLAELVERPALPALSADDTAIHDRLFLAVASLFQGLPKTAVVLLEDLQWADAGSVELLRWLAPRASGWRVLVVATRRPEEPVPMLDLRAVERLELAPLTPVDVDRLVRSLLGGESVDRDLAEHVEREAEGNPFFVMETLNARVSSSDDDALADVASWPTDGSSARSASAVRETLARRLQAVAPEHRRLLHLAALAGRQVDRGLLESLLEGDDPKSRLEAWLQAGIQAWVLEPMPDGGWRFRHDKLRELLSDELEASERQRLHGLLARTIAARGGTADRIAFHGLRSGEPESALEACEAAGLEALEAGSTIDAVRWLTHGLELRERRSEADLEAPGSPGASGVLRYQLARAYQATGRITECRASLERALAELGAPPPQGRAATLGSILWRLPRVFAAVGRRPVSQTASEPDVARVGEEAQTGETKAPSELAAAYMLYSQSVWYENKPLLFADSAMRTFLIAERTSVEHACAASTLASILSLIHFGWARRFAAYTEPLLDPLPPSGNQGWAFSGLASLYLSRGDWTPAQRFQDQAVEACLQAGHQHRHGQLSAWSVALDMLRTEFPAARRRADSLVEMARRRGDPQVQSFGQTYLAELALIEGRFERARQLATEAVDLARAGGDPTEADRGRALRIQALLASGDRATARAESARLVATLGTGGFVTLHSYATVFHCAEVELELLETGDPEARRLAPRAVRALRAYSRRFPIGEPRTLLATARLNRWRRGPRRVQSLVRRAILRAQALNLPFEEAWARRTLAAFEQGRRPEPIYRWDFSSDRNASQDGAGEAERSPEANVRGGSRALGARLRGAGHTRRERRG